MAREPKNSILNSKSRPISESRIERGGINHNPSALLSRPAPPQPYKPSSGGTTPTPPKGRT